MQPFNGYYPPGQSYMQPQYYNPQTAQPIQPQTSGIIWVQGEVGARSYLVSPNTKVALWDSEAPIIYIKTSDQNGVPSMRIIDYTYRDMPQQSQNQNNQNIYVTTDEFTTLKDEVNRLKDIVGGLTNHE
jgi:hypothetical protein